MNLILALVAAMALSGCQTQSKGAAEADISPAAFEHHECVVCGMIVRDQPAPRGQLVHRDGTRVFFCSASDMLTYVDVPSPHGKPAATYVEMNDAAAEPTQFDKKPRPWGDAPTASYVTGVENPHIMGLPILAYPNAQDAAAVAARVGGDVHDWAAIKARNQKRLEK